MSPNSTFGMAFDAPLSQEEEAIISQIEAKHTVVPASTNSPASSPARKKRKRGVSASPNASPSPYKLRGSVKLTERALNAGYRANTSHIFRQDPSGGSTPLLNAGSGAGTSQNEVGGKSNSIYTSILHRYLFYLLEHTTGSNNQRASTPLAPGIFGNPAAAAEHLQGSLILLQS